MQRLSPAAFIILFVAALLVPTAIGVVIAEQRESALRAERSRPFQLLVRGLGMGPKATLSECEGAFDARRVVDWSDGHGPVICGEYFCPHHAGSVLPLSPRADSTEFTREARHDAEVR